MAAKKENNAQQVEYALSFTQAEVQELDTVIGNMPTKFGLPLIQLITRVQMNRRAEKEKKPEVPSNP